MKLAPQGIYKQRSRAWAIALSLVLSSCVVSPGKLELPEPTNSEKSAQPTPSAKLAIAEEIKATKPWKIIFATKDNQNLYNLQAWSGAEEAGKDFGVQMMWLSNDCNECVKEQIIAITEAIASGGIDGMIVMATDSVRLAPAIEKAIDAGIPVIAMDTPVNSDRLETFVVFDNYTAGMRIGEWVVEQLQGRRGRVLLLDGSESHQNGIDRRNGFLAGLQKGDIEFLEAKSGHWKYSDAKKITAEWLQRFDRIDAIVAANDDMALGACDAVVAANRHEILVTGFDAVQPALRAIKQGKMAATIDQLPKTQARLAVQLMLRHLETGETFPPQVMISDIALITQGNIDDYLSEQSGIAEN